MFRPRLVADLDEPLSGQVAASRDVLMHLGFEPDYGLEIGMLILQDPKLLLIDEPAAGMTDEETMRTAELCLSLAGRHSVVVVEHDMDFIARIARKVTVLHEGSVLAEGPMDDVQADPRVIEVYLGR